MEIHEIDEMHDLWERVIATEHLRASADDDLLPDGAARVVARYNARDLERLRELARRCEPNSHSEPDRERGRHRRRRP